MSTRHGGEENKINKKSRFQSTSQETVEERIQAERRRCFSINIWKIQENKCLGSSNKLF